MSTFSSIGSKNKSMAPKTMPEMMIIMPRADRSPPAAAPAKHAEQLANQGMNLFA